jgi:hypothetical protein
MSQSGLRRRWQSWRLERRAALAERRVEAALERERQPAVCFAERRRAKLEAERRRWGAYGDWRF